MKIAVISDLHLGRRDGADLFGHDESAFARFLEFLETNFERIVLLGDIYETLTSRLPQRQALELRAARQAYRALVRRFTGPQYTYVHGNHDLIAGRVLGAPEEVVLEADGVRVLFTHGHRHDWVIRHARWLSESAVWAGGWLRRVGLSRMFHALDAIEERLRGAAIDPTACTFQRWALAQAERVSAEVVITGHTHHAMRVEHGARLFLNSGSCAQGQFSFLSVDTVSGDYALRTNW
jgi:predicted phosphodiesterase